MKRTALLIFLVPAICSISFGQASFKSLTPGTSTRADAVRVLGAPLREVTETLAEYRSESEANKIFVQFARESKVIERIEIVYPAGIERSALGRELNIPSSAAASQVNGRGKFEEYFSAGCIVLIYAGADTSSNVSRVSFVKREMFDSSVPKQAASPAPSSKSVDPPKSAGPPAERIVGQPSRGVTTLSSERVTGVPPQPAPGSGSVTLVSTPGGLRSGQGGPPGTDRTEPETEIRLNNSQLKAVAGSYKFESTGALTGTDVVIETTDRKLLWNDGSGKVELIATGFDVSENGERTTLRFKLIGRPGAKLEINMILAEVAMVLYSEDRSGKLLTAGGTRKPQ